MRTVNAKQSDADIPDGLENADSQSDNLNRGTD